VVEYNSKPAMPLNYGFESGLDGWTTNTDFTPSGLYPDAVTAYHGYGPQEGAHLAAIEAGLGPDVPTTLSRTFSLRAGATISGYAGFQSNDTATLGGLNTDYGSLSINDSPLLSWRSADFPDFGASGWKRFAFTAPRDGDYTLELAVANGIDNVSDSGAVLDGVTVSDPPPGENAVPEPSSLAVLLSGAGWLGVRRRRGWSRHSGFRFGISRMSW
jgi:hypothetical protein